MKRKAFLVLGVIVIGFLVGAFFANIPLFINNKSASSTGQPIPTQKANSKDLQVKLVAIPTTIKERGDLNPSTDLPKIDKATLKVTYQNNTQSTLTGAEIWITTVSENTTGVATTTLDTEYDSKNSLKNVKVFHVPDVPKGSTDSTNFYFFIKGKGQAVIYAEVKAQNKQAKTNSVVIKGI